MDGSVNVIFLSPSLFLSPPLHFFSLPLSPLFSPFSSLTLSSLLCADVHVCVCCFVPLFFNEIELLFVSTFVLLNSWISPCVLKVFSLKCVGVCGWVDRWVCFRFATSTWCLLNMASTLFVTDAFSDLSLSLFASKPICCSCFNVWLLEILWI